MTIVLLGRTMRVSEVYRCNSLERRGVWITLENSTTSSGIAFISVSGRVIICTSMDGGHRIERLILLKTYDPRSARLGLI